MLDHWQHQNIADGLKAHIDRAPRPDQRRYGNALIHRFEQLDTPWNLETFKVALAANPGFRFDEREIGFAGESDQAYTATVALLTRYLELVQIPVPQPLEGKPL